MKLSAFGADFALELLELCVLIGARLPARSVVTRGTCCQPAYGKRKRLRGLVELFAGAASLSILTDPTDVAVASRNVR